MKFEKKLKMTFVSAARYFIIVFLVIKTLPVVCNTATPGKEVGDWGNGMQFTENKGQLADLNHKLRPDILYSGDGGGVKVYLRKEGVSYE